MKWLLWTVGSCLALGLLYWGWGYYRSEAQFARVDRMRKELTERDGRSDMSREERREKWREFRSEAEKLTEEQRERMWSDNPLQRQIDEFFSLPVEQRTAFLDRQLDEWDRRRGERDRERERDPNRQRNRGRDGQRDGNRGGGGPPTGGGPSRAGAPGGGAPSGTNRSSTDGGRGSRRSNPERREQERRDRLNKTSPEQRAKYSEYFRMIRERRQQRSGGR